MSTTVVVILSVALAGALAFALKRFENRRSPKDNACSQLVNEAFANAGNTADSVILQRLLVHQDQCLGNATYVDRARRLFTNTQQFDKARLLLENADRQHAFTPDELKAQNAWIDLAEAHSVWVNGDEANARVLRDQAIAAADSLRIKWPEWSLPYRILDDAESESWAVANSEKRDYYRQELDTRSRKWNGAFIRNLSDWQPIVFTFLISLVGILS